MARTLSPPSPHYCGDLCTGEAGVPTQAMDGLEDEIARRVEQAEAEGIDPSQRGATWTYLTTDQPFGTWTERITRGLMRRGAGWHPAADC